MSLLSNDQRPTKHGGPHAHTHHRPLSSPNRPKEVPSTRHPLPDPVPDTSSGSLDITGSALLQSKHLVKVIWVKPTSSTAPAAHTVRTCLRSRPRSHPQDHQKRGISTPASARILSESYAIWTIPDSILRCGDIISTAASGCCSPWSNMSYNAAVCCTKGL